jgi:hypothetical protein
MGKFNQELMNAGVFLGADGLHPSSKGKRVRFSGQQRIVIDGPFSETKELVGGYWLSATRWAVAKFHVTSAATGQSVSPKLF